MLAPLPIEIAFSHFFQSFSSPILDIFFLAVTYLGDSRFWFAIVAFIYWQGREKRAFFLATAILVAGAAAGVMKEIFIRPRPSPDEFRVIAGAGSFAFPSGHAAISAGILGYSWEKLAKRAKIAGIIVVFLVMASRVYLGVHFLGDVIVGAIVGILAGRLVHEFDTRF